jgi:mRNA interferase YafQ
MLIPFFTNKFKKDLTLAQKRHYGIDEINEVIAIIITEEPLPERCRNHFLHGSYEGKMECHIQPDWLLIYQIDISAKRVVFHRTGTHSDLF